MVYLYNKGSRDSSKNAEVATVRGSRRAVNSVVKKEQDSFESEIKNLDLLKNDSLAYVKKIIDINDRFSADSNLHGNDRTKFNLRIRQPLFCLVEHCGLGGAANIENAVAAYMKYHPNKRSKNSISGRIVKSKTGCILCKTVEGTIE